MFYWTTWRNTLVSLPHSTPPHPTPPHPTPPHSTLGCAALRCAGLGWARLGWAGLGWAGLVTTQPSCCCSATEAGKELATTKPNYLALMQFKIFYDIFCLKYKIFFCLVYETMKKCWREVGGVSQRVVVAPSEHAQVMAGGRSGRTRAHCQHCHTPGPGPEQSHTLPYFIFILDR